MNRKKKILMVLGSFYGQSMGGAEYQAYLLAKALLERGYDVYYLFRDNGEEIHCDIPIELVSIKSRPLLRSIFGHYYVLDYFKLIKIFMKIKPDIIYTRVGSAYTGIVAKYCKSYNCKMFWHIALESDVVPQSFALKRTFIFDTIDKKVLEYGIRNSDYIIGQASYQDDLLFQNYKRNCEMIVPNFHPAPVEKLKKSQSLSVVWIANIKKAKQPHYFVKLTKAISTHEETQFLMIGRDSDGILRDGFSHEFKSNTNLRYCGELNIDEVNELLSRAHLLVNTSRCEGFPNTFIQAWMRKVPVISLSVDPDNILKKEKIGFHSVTLEQMIHDTQTLINDKSLREEIGNRAQKFALKNYSLSNTSKIVDLMEKIT